MAFTVQNDDGDEEGANSYLSVEDFQDYHDDRGNDYGDATDEEIEQALVRATDFIDGRFRFNGTRLLDDEDQTTEWPRADVVNREGDEVLGLPRALLNATAEYALRALSANPLIKDAVQPSDGRLIRSKSESVGPLSSSVTYESGTGLKAAIPAYPTADNWLKAAGLVKVGGTVERG